MAISQYGNDYYGLSGDDKPLGTPLNGRKFTEMDTSKEYRFDAENQQWLQQNGGGSSTLSGLTDVNISNPTDGQTLVFNGTTGKWENGAGGVLFVHFEYDEQLDMEVCDTTWQTIYDALASGTVVLVSSSNSAGALAGARYEWVALAVTPGLNNDYPENYVILVFGPSASNTIVGNYYICSSAADYPHTV